MNVHEDNLSLNLMWLEQHYQPYNFQGSINAPNRKSEKIWFVNIADGNYKFAQRLADVLNLMQYCSRVQTTSDRLKFLFITISLPTLRELKNRIKCTHRKVLARQDTEQMRHQHQVSNEMLCDLRKIKEICRIGKAVVHKGTTECGPGMMKRKIAEPNDSAK